MPLVPSLNKILGLDADEYDGRYEKVVLLSCVDVSLLNIVNEVIYIS
jgi:hypothetical protein